MSIIHAPSREAVRLAGPPARVLLIQAPYYDQVVGGMRTGAEGVFAEAGATLDVVNVAGAFELPATLRCALIQQAVRYDGFLILGCVVKGETDHYEHICRETCTGVMGIAAETGAAIGFGLLTVHTLQQALERSGEDKHNKGAEAAHALLMQVALRRAWGIA